MHQDQVNADLLAFIDEPTEPAKLLAIEAVDTNDATLITLDEQ
jgi:hypothetical protein